MATKNATYKGGNLIDTTTDIVGWVANDSSGLKFVASDSAEMQHAYCTLTHMVTETNNPIWNQIKIDNNLRNTTASSLFEGHITLQGIKPDGTINDIMEEQFTSTSTTAAIRTFELLGSSCTNEAWQVEASGATGGAGTIDVGLPMRYSKYEDVDVVGAWLTGWGYRRAITLERTNGQLHGAHGHSSDYYGTTVYVPYSANMSSTTQADVRFTGPDGVTELPFYQLDVADSTSGTYIVMVPWGWMDKETETYTYTYIAGSHIHPQYIYCYYGNAAATSASDVSLGGHALFYDDFEDDARSEAMWTQVEPANSSVTIDSGYLELRSNASQDSTPYAYANMDFSASDSTSWEIVWKIIYDTPAYNNTTASNGPYLRIRGRDNTGSGGADETSSYWEVKHFYIAAGAGESSANIAGHMWGHALYDSGVLADGTNYANNINCAVSDDQYIKARWNKRDTAGGGTNYMQWYQSDDGVNWNSIGDASTLTSVMDTVTDLQCAMYYVGKAGVAADKYIRIGAVMAYPIMSGTIQHIRWEESFQNGTYLDRYASLNTAASRTIVETQDSISLGTVAGQAVWGGGTYNALCLYLGGGVTAINYNQQDVFIYETTIHKVTEGAPAGGWQDGGLHLSDRTGTTSSDAAFFGLRYTATGSVRNFVRRIWVNGAINLEDGFGGWTQADLPIGLRMVYHMKERIVYYQARKYGSGGEWQTLFRSPTAFERFITGAYSIPMLIMVTSANNQTSRFYFSNWTWDNGGGIIDCHGKTMSTATAAMGSWFPEESYADDYPLAIIGTPGENDKVISFTAPTPHLRNTPMMLRTKDFGGDYNYSKTLYVSDADLIEVGPAGTDQYIGMRLVFDFNMSADDEIEFDKVEFIYEVI